MPGLVFWNLAGGSRGSSTGAKPVTTTDEGTSLVSGYSQRMLKVFLEGGTFEAEEQESCSANDDDDADAVAVDQPEAKKKKKAKIDPASVMNKAIGHEAYDRFRMVD